MIIQLHKMNTSMGNPIEYSLHSKVDKLVMNELINKKIQIKWNGNIFCQKCAKKTKNSFGDSHLFTLIFL